MNFASDNTSPAAPGIVDALLAANTGCVPSYGAEHAMDELTVLIRDLFESPQANVFLVGTGTAANALAVASVCPPWGTVFCHRESHVNQDECGAPEFFTGGSKLTLVDGDHARIDSRHLQRALEETGCLGVHNVQPGSLSLTNATEFGTVYMPDEISALTSLARDADIPTHLDGARFANALIATASTPAELSWRVGIDILTLGGTKNGLFGAEAVIFFNPSHIAAFEFRRKRAGHLHSKHRYLSAQMLAYLQDDLWLKLAQRANAAASTLANGLRAIPSITLIHPAQANMIFFSAPRSLHRFLRERGAVYYLLPPDPDPDGAEEACLTGRLVCNWQTDSDSIDSFLDHCRDYQ
ncbi:MAG: beta-eliminating lyase-related protein [Rhodobacteraceae bacterium]|nr:beta-eliminating lyase-related protein [Paracoccaceae bacterium]